jgi:hypothetical protein
LISGEEASILVKWWQGSVYSELCWLEGNGRLYPFGTSRDGSALTSGQDGLEMPGTRVARFETRSNFWHRLYSPPSPVS